MIGRSAGTDGPGPGEATRRSAVTAALGLSLLGSSPLAAQAPASTVSSADAGGVDLITADGLRRHIGVLAHDSMRGRDTPSPELEKTAAYVASQFRAVGLKPGLGDGYQQRFPLTVVAPAPAERQRLRLRGPGTARDLDPTTDFVAAPTAQRARASGPLVPWRPEAAAAPKGGVLAVPADPGSLRGAFRGVRSALTGGDAAGALVVVDAPPRFLDRIRGYFQGRRVSLGEPDELAKPVVLVARASLPDALREALEEGDAGTEIDGWEAQLETRADVRAGQAMNTVGWLEGSDPDLRDEYVIFTAHMDHVGVGEPVEGDSIYNGADDDASGTATVLEVARAFASREERPRRSLVFLTVSGEEKGLLGSRWYAEHPLFSLERTVAALNLDMVGRNWRDTVVAIGQDESTLGATVQRVAEEHPGLGLTVVKDRWPEENFYYRSDHYSFARKGVPILFFFSGVHEDYHRPSDEASKIRYEKTARIARFVYLLGREVADADRAPRWDEEAYERVVEDARNL